MADKTNNTKSIETDQLTVKGNIMTWENTVIQLSNVSCIATYPLAKIPFPVWSLVLAVVGLLALKANLLLALGILLACSFWIAIWANRNENNKLKTYLNIVMNSGNTLSILFYDKEFMEKVLEVLELIIVDGGVGRANINIDIKGNSFSGNAKVLNDLNL